MPNRVREKYNEERRRRWEQSQRACQCRQCQFQQRKRELRQTRKAVSAQEDQTERVLRRMDRINTRRRKRSLKVSRPSP